VIGRKLRHFVRLLPVAPAIIITHDLVCYDFSSHHRRASRKLRYIPLSLPIILFEPVSLKTLRLCLFSFRSVLARSSPGRALGSTRLLVLMKLPVPVVSNILCGGCLPKFHSFNLSPSRSVVSCSNLVLPCIAICDLSLCRRPIFRRNMSFATKLEPQYAM
jgi:hypothetical protein